MDGNGECCIANWGDDTNKMDMIMLKFRPIAPKPVGPNVGVGPTLGGSDISQSGGCHAKMAGRGRRKTGTTTNRINKGRKRKSNSPDNQTAEIVPDHHHHDDYHQGGGGVTLLALFPEAPDLSPAN
ncbi:hypothetical protein RND81_13G093000 [Saponaria officinalis]|uniref:Uncharacterized protein n=1 Tax=Saponaria officinalis TaxID=3572 RepID=A0AAW1GYG5_SAPOF